jgi:hypothetical protein
MIEILGSDVGAERFAADDLKMMFETLWPDVKTSRLLAIDIFAGAKLYGRRVQDIDLLVLIDFQDAPKTIVQGANRITIASACIIVETKDHDPRGVKFEWNKVFVRYDDGWFDATEKSFKQVHSLRSYLREGGVGRARIENLIWLRGVPASDLPPGPHNIIGSDVNAAAFISQLSASSGESYLVISRDIGSREATAIRKVMTRRLAPTACDRQKLERLLADNPLDGRIDLIGEKQIELRGRGGTGKTMTLLRAAWRLSKSQGKRTLILTYNKALRSDILRQLVLAGIDVGVHIDVRTVHSFLRPLLIELGLLSNDAETDQEFFSKFEDAKNEAVTYLREAATQEDIDDLKARFYDEYGWDVIGVDEGQDWPANERDLLRLLYGAENMIIADGVEQLVRDVKPCDWGLGLHKGQVCVIEMQRSLRLKSNLGRFASLMTLHLNQPNWHVDVTGAVPGGRVVVLDGAYFHDRAWHDSLRKQNAVDGNGNIDMLFCVPPDVASSGADGKLSSAVSALQDWDYDVWDGTSAFIRDGYPVSPDQLRVVQYESCRGLEGWTVVCCDLDRFYDLKYEHCDRSGEMISEAEERARFAFRWLLIPLTRAISTLVITLRSPTSELRDALLKTRNSLPEVVEWHTLPRTSAF